MAESDITVAFWIGVLFCTAASIAAGLTYAAFNSQRGFNYSMRTLLLIVTAVCIFIAGSQHINETDLGLGLLFLAICVPFANLITIGILAGIVWYWKKKGYVVEQGEVSPYLGPVPQTPVDVPKDERTTRFKR